MAHNLPNGLVAPLKDNPDEGYEQDININADSLAANGFYPQNSTSSDAAAGVYRDSSGNLVLKDASAGTKTLTQLSTGGVEFGTPVAVGSVNSQGVATTATRSDHVHAHGSQSGGSLHDAATSNSAGFMSSADKSKLDSVTLADLTTANEKAALAGTSGTAPSGTNKLVDSADTRLSDARTPTAHASSHAAAGSDPLTLSQSQVTGLTTDLAAKVATTRSVIAGTGLSGGGTLASDVTLSLVDAGTAGTYGSASAVPVLTTDAKGRVTSVTGTTISITSSNVSNFSTAVKTVLGSSVSSGTGIGISFNAVTGVLTVSNSGVISVNGSTGAISNVALTTGKLSQFAATTSAELAGVISDETGSGALVFGTAPTLAQVTLSAGTTTTVPLKFTSGTNLTTAVAGAVEWDGSSLYLTQTSGPTRKTVAYTDSSITGNAATATKLSASKTFALTGDVTGSTSSDLTTGPSIAATLASVGTAGTYGSATQVPVLTTDAKGRVTGVTNTSITIAQSAVTNLASDLSSRPTGSATAGQIAYWSGTSALAGESNLTWDATNNRLVVGGMTQIKRINATGDGGTVYFTRSSDDTNAFNLSVIGSTSFPELRLRDSSGTSRYTLAYDGSSTVIDTTTTVIKGTANTPGVGGDSSNTVLGTGAYAARTTATQNVAIGNAALAAVTANTGNVAVGYNAGAAYTGYGSVIVGATAGNAANSGGYNTLIGYGAGASLSSGNSNVIIGNNNGTLLSGTNYNVLIGGMSTGVPHLFINGSGYGYIPGRLMVGTNSTPSAPLHTTATNENLRMQGNDPWFTFYTVAGARKGWMGYGDGASTTTLTITNETASGSIRFAPGSGGVINCTGNTVPNANNTYQLGTSGQAWSQVWSNAGAFNTSDARAKTDIQDTTLGLSFIEALRPVSYKFKVAQNDVVVAENGTETVVPRPGVRPHQGFIAQEVKAVMDAQGVEDFAGYAHDEQADVYALRYEEFIAPLTKAVQELSAKVAQLEAELAALKGS